MDRALHSVIEYTSDMSVEVILTDNGSEDDTVEMVAKNYPSVKIIRNADNIGYAPAMNMCLTESRGRYALCLSVDAQLLPNSVQTLIAFMEAHPKCGLAGPRTINVEGEVLTTMHHPNLLLSIWGEIIPAKKWLRGNGRLRRFVSLLAPNSSGLTSNYSQTQKVHLLSGGILLARRRFLEEVGLLDANMPLGPDDYDWCMRAHMKGYKVWYVAESNMVHRQKPKEDVLRVSPIYLYARLSSLLYFYRKYHSGLSLHVFELSVKLLDFKWKTEILRHYGRNSIQFEALRAGSEICRKPERYLSELTTTWIEKARYYSQ
ncbi:MAG: glycosyltransferase [Thaumarchaeota archaeon]|nr:glycosyltransferase [Nitrososphaerota archaeon]